MMYNSMNTTYDITMMNDPEVIKMKNKLPCFNIKSSNRYDWEMFWNYLSYNGDKLNANHILEKYDLHSTY